MERDTNDKKSKKKINQNFLVHNFRFKNAHTESLHIEQLLSALTFKKKLSRIYVLMVSQQ